MINYENFSQIELRIGEVKSAERVPNSDKLLKLMVDLGEGTPRQIIAGIGRVYTPEDLLGRQITVVANLEPRIIMGLESQGMVLAADSGSGPVFLTPERAVPLGVLVK